MQAALAAGNRIYDNNRYTENKKIEGQEKPSWNGKKVYRYLEDMNQGFLNYQKEANVYYTKRISAETGDSALSVEELKGQIKEWFPEYTLTSREPEKPEKGSFLLYIDETNINKMASDSSYRARVYGLMDRELQGKNGYTLQYSDGRNVTTHLTGSTVCVAESNRKYAGADGIPYLGGATCDLGAWSAKSHPQVRNERFLSDHYNSVSAVKGVKENASGKLVQRQEEKRAEWKKEDQARAHEEAQEWAAERREQREKLLQAVREERLEAKEAVQYEKIFSYVQESWQRNQQL